MAFVKSKGTAIQQDIIGVFTTMGQVISLSLDGIETETYESDTLDNANAGIPYETTGRAETGSVSGEMFYDPALATQKTFLDLIETPAEENWKILFADASTWAFTGAGVSLGITAALNDGLKATFGIKVDGDITFPA